MCKGLASIPRAQKKGGGGEHREVRRNIFSTAVLASFKRAASVCVCTYTRTCRNVCALCLHRVSGNGECHREGWLRGSGVMRTFLSTLYQLASYDSGATPASHPFTNKLKIFREAKMDEIVVNPSGRRFTQLLEIDQNHLLS